MMININNLTLTLADNADWNYRSCIGLLTCTNPDNWVKCDATDNGGNIYHCWYCVEDGTELDSIDYSHPDDITDDFGKVIYDKEAN